MLLDLIVSVIHKGAGLKRAFWRRVYEMMARRFTNPELHFMNYGWAPPEGDDPTLQLDSDDEERRRWIQLYHHVTRGVDMAGKEVIEVGSGRGGGSNWMARSSGAAQVTGIDFSHEAVALCGRIHEGKNLRFIQGDAEALPLPDNSVDVVVNVESSHCYGNMEAFAAEAARVLRPGGIFCWADLWLAKQSHVATDAFDGTGLERVRTDDITEGVVRSLDLEGEARAAMLRDIGPWFLQPLLRTFGGVPGTSVYNGLAQGKIIYLCRRYAKPG
jgi:SAM-dependent methyltransferase